MRRLTIASLALPLLLTGFVQLAAAHCEVPCGIYADQRRFEEMLEDTATIAKSIAQINEIVTGMNEGPNPQAVNQAVQGVNQAVRWVNTKESHATNTQTIIAQYFMTQRIKPDAEGYIKKLTAAHAVMQAAMKCKQNTAPEAAEVLKKAILDFYRAYEGKEPAFDD